MLPAACIRVYGFKFCRCSKFQFLANVHPGWLQVVAHNVEALACTRETWIECLAPTCHVVHHQPFIKGFWEMRHHLTDVPFLSAYLPLIFYVSSSFSLSFSNLSLSFSLSVSVSHTHTYTRTHTHFDSQITKILF